MSASALSVRFMRASFLPTMTIGSQLTACGYPWKLKMICLAAFVHEFDWIPACPSEADLRRNI
jgi:hypothetical protein